MSIRTRLTIFYTTLLALLLLLFGAGIYAAVSLVLRQQVETNLQSAAEAILTDARANTETRVISLPAFNVFERTAIYAQYIDPKGEIKARSSNHPDFDKHFFKYDFAALSALPLDKLEVMKTEARINNRSFFVVTRPILGEKSQAVIGYLQVATSLEEVESAKAALLRVLLWMGSVSVLLSAIGGALMAWRALRPVDKITQTARQILSSESLDQRVPIHGHPSDEVGRLAHAFNDMLDRLSKLFRAQQRLVADVSHELRTPLTVLRGNVDLLRSMGCADMESLDAMTRETDRMTRMVGNVLLLSQADAGVLPMHMQILEIAPLLKDVVRDAQVLAGERVHIESNLCSDALVKGDADRLKQVFLNLVENAIKHTPTHGRVFIDCVTSEPKTVTIAVSDTGMGIPAADLPHVFERFYRVDKSRSRANGGAGLGLSIALSIVQNHHGQMSVRSKEGVGTAFEVHLPAFQPSLTAA